MVSIIALSNDGTRFEAFVFVIGKKEECIERASRMLLDVDKSLWPLTLNVLDDVDVTGAVWV